MVVVVVVTVLWLAALLIDGSPTFNIRDAGGDRFSAQAAECTRDPRTPGYNVWRLHWQAEASAHVTVHRRTVITAFGRSFEVWLRDQESSPTFAGTMEGVTAGDGVSIANKLGGLRLLPGPSDSGRQTTVRVQLHTPQRWSLLGDFSRGVRRSRRLRSARCRRV